MAIRTWLELAGIDATLGDSASDGFQAFDMFNFDLRIVDIFMPKIDGLEAIKAFRKSAPAIPISVMSGLASGLAAPHPTHPAPDFIAMAMRLGASYGLQKPFLAEQLMVAVKTCLGELPNTHRWTFTGVT